MGETADPPCVRTTNVALSVPTKPVVDTAVVCQHWREVPHDRKDFTAYKDQHPELAA